jgi:hypothetical protein
MGFPSMEKGPEVQGTTCSSSVGDKMRYQIALLIAVMGICISGSGIIGGGGAEYARSHSRPDQFLHFDGYGEIPFAEEKVRLDNFGEAILASPDARNFVVIYGGKQGNDKTVKCRTCRALRYLLEEKHVPPARLAAVVINGEYNKELTTELWRTPIEYDGDMAGGHPDVPENQIEYIKGTEVLSGCGAVPGNCR